MSALRKMEIARAELLLAQPFFGSIALYLALKEDPACKTAWTDGESMGFNPEWALALSDKVRAGVLAHEVLHLACRHHLRRGKREMGLWQRACDLAINPELRRAGLSLPVGHFYEACFDGMAAEEIYSALAQEQRQEQAAQSAQAQASAGDQGAGEGQEPSQGEEEGQEPGSAPEPQEAAPCDPGGCGEVRDAPEKPGQPSQAEIAGEWEIRVAQAMAAEKARQAGNLSGDTARLFDKLKASVLDWREALRRFINDRSRVDVSWMRPNKRYLHQGFVLPGNVPDGINQLAVVIDTSGSIDEKTLTRFASELQAAVDEGATRRVIVLYCDAAVKRADIFEEGDEIKFKPEGGGGTRFSPALEWIERNEPDTSAIIYFTDLCCSDFGPEPSMPCLWLAYGSANAIRARMASVPFGEVVHLVE